MKKKTERKLKLTTHILRALCPEDLRRAGGAGGTPGEVFTRWQPPESWVGCE